MAICVYDDDNIFKQYLGFTSFIPFTPVYIVYSVLLLPLKMKGNCMGFH